MGRPYAFMPRLQPEWHKSYNGVDKLEKDVNVK